MGKELEVCWIPEAAIPEYTKNHFIRGQSVKQSLSKAKNVKENINGYRIMLSIRRCLVPEESPTEGVDKLG